MPLCIDFGIPNGSQKATKIDVQGDPAAAQSPSRLGVPLWSALGTDFKRLLMNYNTIWNNCLLDLLEVVCTKQKNGLVSLTDLALSMFPNVPR